MTLKRFADFSLNKRVLPIAGLALAIAAVVAVIPELERTMTPAHAQSFSNLSGNYVVQAGGTAFFYTSTNGTTEVLHYTMAGSANFINGSNTATNLTVNLGGEDDYSSQGEYNELICYLTQPGDLFYTVASGSTPAMLTVTYHNGDKCGNPAGINASGIGPGNGGVSELGNLIPFNFYPSSGTAMGGVIVSNYDYLTTGGANLGPANYPHGWIDSGSYGGGSHVAYGFSVTGQVTPVTQ